jgi:hypothetical protein
MDGDALSKAAKIIPEAKRESFASYLRNLPKTPGLVDRPHRTEERLQGDIFRRLPICILDATGSPKVADFAVTVLNNTCDLQPARRPYVNISPVYDFFAFREQMEKEMGQRAAQYLSDVTENRVDRFFYVENCPEFQAGAILDFSKVTTVSTELYEAALRDGTRCASFTQNGFYILLLKMTNYLARAETPDVARVSLLETSAPKAQRLNGFWGSLRSILGLS